MKDRRSSTPRSAIGRRLANMPRGRALTLGVALPLALALLAPLIAMASHPNPFPTPTTLLTVPMVENLSDCRPDRPSMLLASSAAVDRSVTGQNNRHAPGSNGTVAVWANSTAYPVETGLDIPGSHQVVHGLVVSRSHIKMGGSWNQLQHGTEYSHRSKSDKPAFDLTGSNNCFSPIPARVNRNSPNGPPPPGTDPNPPRGFPFRNSFDPDDDGNFAEHFDNVPGPPGQDFAALAMADPAPGPQYFVCGVPDPDGAGTGAAVATGCSGNKLDRAVQGSQLASGLYYVTGETILSASNLIATVTIYSGAQLKVNGSNQSRFLPYTQNLLFASNHGTAQTQNGEDALKVEGSTSTFEGIIVAFRGRTELAGSQNKFTCPVMGDRVRLNGQLLYINTEGCAPSPSLTIDKTPDGGLAGTINAGDVGQFTIKVKNSGAGVANNVLLSDDLPADGGLTWTLTSAVKNGTTNVAAQCTTLAGGALPNGNELDCAFGNLAPNDEVIVVLTSSATSSAQHCGDLPNGNGVLDNGLGTATTTDDATAVADNNGPVTNPGQIIVACPEVSVVKTPDESNPPGPGNDINAGEDAVFSITFTNNGPGVASSVGLSDQLPGTANGLDWSIVDQGAGPGFTGGTACSLDAADLLTCTVTNMASGASYRVRVKATTSPANCGSINNTVTITPAGDINPANNSDTGEIDVACPTVSVVKTPDGGPAGTINAGDAAVFTTVVSNSGAGTANGVTLSDDLPNDGGLTWTVTSATKNPGGIDVSAQCAIVNGNELDCAFGNLTSGQSVTVVLTSSANTDDTCGELANGNGELDNGLNTAGEADDATADATNADPDFDPGQIIVACPNLTVDKTPDGGAAGTITAGSAAVFTVVVNNSGPGTATGVTLSDDLPNDGGLTWSLTSATKNPGGTDVAAQCTTLAGGALPNGNELDCAFGNLTSGQSVTVVLTSSANTDDTCGELANGNGELDNGLNTASTADDAITDATNDDPDEDPGQIIVACPSLTVDKTPDGGLTGTIEAGDAAVFTIVASNSGPGTATGVTLSDDLPNDGGLTWTVTSATKNPGGIDVSGQCAIVNGNELDCAFGDLTSGQSVTVVLTSSATSSAQHCGDLPNGNGVLDNGLDTASTADDAIADATNDDPDEDPGQIIVACPDVSVVKTPDESDPAGPGNDINAGQDAVFSILVTNHGPGVAASIPLSDTLPFTGGLDWSIVDQGLGPGFTGGSACTVTDGGLSNDILSCTITNLVENGQYRVRVKSATTPLACGTIPNTVTITPAGDINAANNSDTGEIDVNCAAIRILKQSTKTGNPLVRNPGALFSVDGPDAGPEADFTVRDDNNPGGAGTRSDEATALGIGVVCVSALAPGIYTVNETSPPMGYGASSQTNVVAVAVTGTNCTDSLPAPADTAAFQNPPLADIQVNYRDGGSTETSLTSIDCDNNGLGADTLDLLPAPMWQQSVTHLGIPINPSPRTITCTIVIDP